MATTPPERLAEITCWLQHPISVADALHQMAEFELKSNEPDQCGVRSLRTWVEQHLEPGDELWWYDTGEIRGKT